MDTKFSEDEVRVETLKYFDGDELATNVWMNKYALRDNDNNLLEKTPNDMHKRLSREFERTEKNYPNSLSYDEIYEHLKEFKYIVPAGSPLFGIGNNFSNISISNCFALPSPKDSLSSIFDTAKNMANIMKRRGGIGINLSDLRPENSKVNNSAKTSTGAYSFADFYSYITRVIGQHNRRGACLLTMHISHPDIIKFIKSKEDRKKITGANISILITDKFMNAVSKNESFKLKFPIDSKNVYSSLNAEELWELIIETVTKNGGEPGLVFWDRIVNYNPSTCYENQKIVCLNACGEQNLPGLGACILMNINLKSFVNNKFKDDCYFDFDKFQKVTKIATRLIDDLVDIEIEKIDNLIATVDDSSEQLLWKNIENILHESRRVGLGIMGLADVFACMKIRYDSEKAIQLTNSIFEFMRNNSYRESINLSKERGSFDCFDWNKEKDNLFIQTLPENIKNDIEKYGRRNLCLLTIPPTGTTSIITKVSSGMEPVFRNSLIRRRKISDNKENIIPDFVDALGDKWKEYTVHHTNIEEWRKQFGFDKDLPDFFVESNNINWEKRIEIQSVIQKYLDASISSTINLPKGTSSEIVGGLFLKAFESGLKGITIYIDGSRDGVLIPMESNQNIKKLFIQNNAPKRPKQLECDIHHINVHEKSWIVLIGLFENKPYEIFAGESEKIVLPKKYKKGIIIKEKAKNNSSLYTLIIKESDDKEDDLIIKDLVNIFNNDTNGAFTRLLSTSLRHGTPVKYVVEQIKKNKSEDMFSFSKVIARVLKKYINDGEKSSSDKLCPDCKTENIVYKDGCVICTNCGYSKCS